MTAPKVEIRRAGPEAAETFATLSAAAMAGHAGHRWTAQDFAELINDSNVIGLVSVAPGEADPVGYALIRPAADEAELLSIAVAAAWRERGIGAALLTEGARLSAVAGARKIFLEVAEDNPAAIRLYRAAGFAEIARRPDYYGPKVGKAMVDAIVMSAALPLTSSKMT
jgi:ribosomal-protein-alanine N-acetyltransferase